MWIVKEKAHPPELGVYPKFLGDLASNHCHPELQQDRNEVEVLRR